MIDLAASHRHYLQHLLPVWRAIPAEIRGDAYVTNELRRFLPSLPIEGLGAQGPVTLIAGFDDLRKVGARPAILMEHGCGQSYGGDQISGRHPAYSGGDGRHGIVGFLCPNEYAAERNRAKQPEAFVKVIGSPRLASLQGIPPAPPPDEIPTVAVSFHWDCTVCHETMSAWRHWAGAVAKLAESGKFKVLGHAHPRMFRDLAPTYRDMGIEPVESFDEILMRAHVYCCDNSSSMYEFAALRGPVVVLDCPWYRVNVHHGLRYWDAADIGPRIIEPLALPGAITAALSKQPWPGAEAILARVFPPVGDPAQAAADAAVEAAGLTGSMKSRSPIRFPRTAPIS